CSENIVSTTAINKCLEKLVTSIRHSSDDLAELVVDRSPHLSGLVKVADQNIKGLSPSRANTFLKGAIKLSKCTNLSSRVFGSLSRLLERRNLSLRKTKGCHFGIRHVAGHDLKVVRHDICREPVLLQRSVEVALDLCGRGRVLGQHAHSISDLNKTVLHVLVTHTHVGERTPVHQSNRTGRQSLRQLISSTSCTSGRSTRSRSDV